MTPLPTAFLANPIAHRGLHDRAGGIIENSLSAVRAAVAEGFPIELDLQLSADEAAVVFHDETLDRLTAESGPVADRVAEDLEKIALTGGSDTIRRLETVLDEVAGRVPLLLEIKDQNGALGPSVGLLEVAVSDALSRYDGAVAVMSFNPHSMRHMARLAPQVPRGLVTDPFEATDWPGVPEERLKALRDIPDFETVGAGFISHNRTDLGAAPVARLRARGVPVLCWTVRSPEDERAARSIADNITFEGYDPRAVRA